MAFTAPVYGQLGGLDDPIFGPPAPQPQQWEDVLGPTEPHNMAAWLREIAAGRTPTWSPSATELQAFTRTANQQALAEAVNARASAQRRMADLGARTGLRDEQLTLYNALDNNVKTLGDVIKQTSAQLEASGEITPRTLIPILNPDGTPSGLSANPFNPDGAPVRTGVSPDQEEISRRTTQQAAEAALRSQEATTRTQLAGQASRDVANLGIVRQTIQAQSARDVAQANMDIATLRANTELLTQQSKSEDITLQEATKLQEQVAKLQQEVFGKHAEVAKQLVADMNANEREWFKGFVENKKIDQQAAAVFQTALTEQDKITGQQDKEAYTSQVAKQTAEGTAAATLVGKMWDSYVGSLKDMSIYPEGWFNAVQKAGRTQAYARQIPGLLAQLQPVTPDVNKLGEFASMVRGSGIFEPTREPNWRPLNPVQPPFQGGPPPTDLRDQQAQNQAMLDQALGGNLMATPPMTQNPYSPDFQGTMTNPRTTTPAGGFQAPIAGLEEPPPAEDLWPAPMPIDTSLPEDTTPFMDQGMEQDLGEYTAPFAGGDPQADLAFYEPLIENAPDQALIPSLLNFMAGLNARDDVADNPEDVLRDEYDYAFGPFGSQYNLDPQDFGDLYSDTTDYGYDDSGYGGIF